MKYLCQAFTLLIVLLGWVGAMGSAVMGFVGYHALGWISIPLGLLSFVLFMAFEMWLIDKVKF